MEIPPHFTGAVLCVLAEQGFQFLEQVGFLAEMTDGTLAVFFRLGDLELHLLAVVTVKAVAFYGYGIDFLAAENVLESLSDQAGARSRRTCYSNDWMFARH